MALPPGLRRLALTAHVTASVGWIGAVIAFLPVAVIGLTSHDPQTARAAHLTMESIGWYALVPLACASLLTGVVQSLGTPWGLFRHYWVVIKLVITVLATVVLLSYTQTLGVMADLAADPSLSSDEFLARRTSSAVVHAAGGLVALLVATVLAIYKPRGMTRYGQRRQHEQRPSRP